jgi:signal transduction histidine kinase/CheY-like chemotaxis protein
MLGRSATSWLNHHSLNWRFLIIGVIVLAPLAATLIQFAGNERAWAMQILQDRARLLVSHALDNLQGKLEDTERLLNELARDVQVTSGGSGCEDVLAHHSSIYKWGNTFRLIGVNGDVVCSDHPVSKKLSAGEGSFIRSIRTPGLVIGNLNAEGELGKLTLTAALPIFEAEKLVGILSANISSDIFGGNFVSLVSDRDISMFIMNQSGELVLHYPPLTNLIGRNVSDWEIARKAFDRAEDIEETDDFDGKRRLFIFRTLPLTNAIFGLGVDQQAVVSTLDSAVQVRLGAVTLTIWVSTFLGMLGLRLLVLTPLGNLVQTARLLEKGDWSARAHSAGAREVKILASVLNRMARAISVREEDLKTAKDLAEDSMREAVRANNAKSDFLATMSHEIRTPLNGIIGYTEQLLAQPLESHQRHHAEIIKVAGYSLLTIANDVLDFAGIETGKLGLKEQAFSVLELIHTATEIVKTGAPKSNVSVSYRYDPSLPDILMGDADRLRQIFLNLLNNAVKFTRNGEVIVDVRHIHTAPEGEAFSISVKDTGIGIPNDRIHSIFDRFSQVEDSISREFGGTGLGLAISKRLIELMGGKIGVESTFGKGSTFWIELTLPRGEIDAMQEAPMPEITHKAPLRILLAEDIAMNRELAVMLLEQAGHSVVAVTSGIQAIETAECEEFDLILMDIQMPKMDGLTAIKLLREKLDRQTPIVAMTANILPFQVQQFKKAGFNDYLAKPLDRRELAKILSQYVPIMRDGRGQNETVRETSVPEYAQLKNLLTHLGTDRVTEWMLIFRRDLHDFALSLDMPPTDAVMNKAHALIGPASMLGWPSLSKELQLFEEFMLTKKGGADIFLRLRLSAEEVLDALEITKIT